MPYQPVEILMATYNGARHIQEQLDSIAAQTHENWHLHVRDDGSTDDTIEITKRFQSKHPSRVSIIKDNKGNLGCAENFMHLLDRSSAPVVAFADQDDIWLPFKIERGVREIDSMINLFGADKPLLTHHDFSIMDDKGRNSQESYDASNGNRLALGKALKHPFNAATHGFTMLFNRALADLVSPVASKSLGHDTYVACLANDFGETAFINQPLASYRRHGSNVSEISPYHIRALKKLFGDKSSTVTFEPIAMMLQEARENLRRKSSVTKSYLEAHGEKLPKERKALLEDFSEIDQLPFLQRKKLLLQHSSQMPITRLVAALAL